MFPLGKEKTIKANRSGILYFRVNDYADSLSDNQGQIEISRTDGTVLPLCEQTARYVHLPH